MLMKRRFAWIAILLTAMILSGCGFHLRGSGDQATLPFKTIYLGAPDASPLVSELQRYIVGGGGTTVATDAKAAEAILEIMSESKEKVILSLNSQGRVREYTLNYKVLFRLKNNQNSELLTPTSITIRRTISFNEAQVLAKEAEETMLYRDMQSDLVQQMLRRIAAIKPTP